MPIGYILNPSINLAPGKSHTKIHSRARPQNLHLKGPSPPYNPENRQIFPFALKEANFLVVRRFGWCTRYCGVAGGLCVTLITFRFHNVNNNKQDTMNHRFRSNLTNTSRRGVSIATPGFLNARLSCKRSLSLRRLTEFRVIIINCRSRALLLL